MHDKVVVVTGASRGIGAAIATAFAKGGAIVFANYPGADAEQHRLHIEQWREEAGLDEGRVIPVQGDVADSDQVAQMFETVRSQFGELDILVNNAGIKRDHTVRKMTDDEWRQVMQVNLDGAFFCCRSAIPLLRECGRIVCISSVVAHTGNFGVANYAASKAGLLGLTRTLALELAARNITVNAVCPGFIDTAMVGDMPADVVEKMVAQIPLKRLGSVQDIASTVLFLASMAAGYITGQAIGINGGLYRGN